MPRLVNGLYKFGDFRLDPQKRTLLHGQEPVALTPKAFDVLLLLIENAGKVVTKDDLMKAVWPGSFVEESNLSQTIFRVRKALEETSDQRFILTVQGQGYRFLVPVTEVADATREMEIPAPAGHVDGVQKAQADSYRRQTRNWRAAAIVSATLLILAIVAYAVWRGRSKREAAEAPGRIMLAVLPFENFTGDPGQDYFSDGLTEEMISQLGNLDPSHLGVIARTSVMHYKRSPESIPQIGQDLGVQYVIEGSVRRDTERVRITAQLIQVKDQSHLWARQYDRDLGHLLELQAEISREVANEIEFSLSGRRPIEAGAEPSVRGAQSYEVYDLYLKGRYFWNKRTAEGFRQAADYFQQAIAKDPSYGRAYAGLADTLSLMSTWYMGPQNELMPKARTAALRALELDESLAEAHASVALIKENYDYDWPEAEKEFQRAIQLNPQYATAHQWYAEFLSFQGRFDEAFAESELARRMDPLSPIIATDHATLFYYSRRYDSALQQCRSVLELDPTFEHARDRMIPFYLQLHRYDDAIAEVNREAGSGKGPWLLAWKAAVYHHAGRAGEARRSLAELEQVIASRPERTPTLLIAYSGTNQKDRVLELLEKAYAEHSNAVVEIKVDPMLDPVRSDPRFTDLLRRLRLGQ